MTRGRFGARPQVTVVVSVENFMPPVRVQPRFVVKASVMCGGCAGDSRPDAPGHRCGFDTVYRAVRSGGG